MAFLLLRGWQSSGYSHMLSPCTEHTHFSPPEETEGKKRVLTFSRVLVKSFGFTWSRFPRMGRGAGPGGIFPFPDLIFHLATLSRQTTQTRRTTDAAPSSSIFQVEESLRGSGGIELGCPNLSLYTEEICSVRSTSRF